MSCTFLGPALSLHACAETRSENTHGKPSSLSSAGLELATRSLPSRSEEQRDCAFISSLMSHRIRFIVTELGPEVDAFTLHIYATLAQRERELIAARTKDALAAAKARGVRRSTKRAN